MEIWKKHSDFNYEISNYGRVRRIGRTYLDHNNIERRKETMILVPRITRGFTAQVTFSKTENKITSVKSYSVSKLVAELYLPQPTEKQVLLEHIDNDPANNKVDNLRWITRQEWNIKHKEMIEKRTILALKIRNDNKLKKKK